MARNKCPACSREFDPVDSSAMPFCCERCRLVDLGRWLDEEYSVTTIAEEPLDESDDQVGMME